MPKKSSKVALRTTLKKTSKRKIKKSSTRKVSKRKNTLKRMVKKSVVNKSSRSSKNTRKRATSYETGVKTRWGDRTNNPLVPEVGELKHGGTGTNWLGTEVRWT